MKLLAIGYVGFRSPNYAEWRRYGPDVLAMPLAADGADGSVRLRMDERHHRFAFHPGEQEDLAYIGWELRNRTAFEEALEELKEKKVPFELATAAELEDRRVLGMAKLDDPSGFRHEIFWGQDVAKEPFLPTRPHQGYVGNELGGPGHVVLMVPELTKAHSEFALNVLGFHASSYLVFSAADGSPSVVEVYRCNERSHCLIWMALPGMRGVGHVHIEVKAVDDLGRTYDMAKQRNLPISMELGRFNPDTDISFYLRTPSGWDLQYGWDTGVGRNHDAENAPSYDGRGGQSIAWGHKPLLPLLNPSIRPVEGFKPRAVEAPKAGEPIDWSASM